jgi:hypothetical protein
MGCKCPYVINVRWTSVSKVLKWFLANRKTLCSYFELKNLAGTATRTWWLLAVIALQYFSNIDITFDALQVDGKVVSTQYNHLERLLNELQAQCGATRDDSLDFGGALWETMDSKGFSMGQFSVTSTAIRTMCLGIDVAASEMEESLNDQERFEVIRGASILYLVTLNGIVRIMTGRQSTHHQGDAIPHVLPLDLLTTSTVQFVALVGAHKSRLLATYDEVFIQDIWLQHKVLIRIISTEPSLRSQLEKNVKKGFAAAWAPMGSRVAALQMFASGIATVIPTTSRVEGDFSLMGYRRNDHCSGLTDFSLEGVMRAKQYDALQEAAKHL